MPPKKGKKKVKKIVSNDVEEVVGNAFMKKLGLTKTETDYGSEVGASENDIAYSQETPRSNTIDDFNQSQDMSNKNQDYGSKEGNQSYRLMNTDPDEELKEGELQQLDQKGKNKRKSFRDDKLPQLVDQQEVIQEIQNMKQDQIQKQLQHHNKSGAVSTTISNPSLQATVDENENLDLASKQQELEQAKLLEKERERVSELLESMNNKLTEFKIKFTNINKDTFMNYDHIDSHHQEVQHIKTDVLAFQIPEDIIATEYKVPLADLEDEVVRLQHDKKDIIHQIDNRITEIEKVLHKRHDEETKALKHAEELFQKQQYDAANKELDKVHHLINEKFQLMKKITEEQQRKEQEEEEERKRQEELEKQRQREEEERKRKEQEELKRKQEEEEKRKQEEERKRQEEERKRQEEEQKRIQQQKEEEEKQKRLQQEEELRIIKEAEELRKKQVEQERKLQEEQERKHMEEIERKQRELEEQERLRKQQEEHDRKLKEEKERKEREERELQLHWQQKQEKERKQRLHEQELLKQKEEQMKREAEEEQRRQQLLQEYKEKEQTKHETKNGNKDKQQTDDQDKQDKENNGGGGGGSLLTIGAILGILIAGGIYGYKMYLTKRL